MSDPYDRVGDMRKTPCQEHKKSMLDSSYFICVGCGEWNIVNGKAVRA